MKYLKINTVTREAEIETETNSRKCSCEVIPIVEPKKSTGIKIRTGCRSEEKRTSLVPAKEVTDRTSRRSIRAPLKPRKKNRIQRLGAPRRPLIKPPRSSTPNHISEEKKERAEQRLKLKIRSCFIEVPLTTKSKNNVKRKKAPPNARPATKFSRDKPMERSERIPPCRHRTPR
jgi:hypothetical protein